MFEALTKLHTATCRNCRGPISMMRGEFSGAEWYHDLTGQRPCPGVPTAWPIDDTIRDVPRVTLPPGVTEPK